MYFSELFFLLPGKSHFQQLTIVYIILTILSIEQKQKMDGRISSKQRLKNWLIFFSQRDGVSTSNYMSGRAIWDKMPEYIFENFWNCPSKMKQFQNFQKSQGWFIPKIAWTNYWLIRTNQQTLCIETNIL